MAHTPNDICLFPQQGAPNDPYLGLACGDPVPSCVAPDRFSRPVTQQPDSFVYPIQPPTVVAVAFFGATYPDSFPAPRRQQPDAVVEPVIDRGATFFDGWAPVRLDRRVPQQPDSFVIALRERTATFFDAVGPPDRRVPLRAQQPEAEAFTPQAIVTTPTFAPPVFPDWLPPRRVQQPDSESLAPRDRTAPLASAGYPDRILRPSFSTADQQSLAFTSTERTASLAQSVFADRLDPRRVQQPDAEALTPRDRTAPAFDAVYPDAVRRPMVLAAHQLAFAFVEPETKVPDDFDAVYPDRLDPRRVQQPDAEAVVLRDRTAPLAQSVFADRLDPRRVQQPDAEALTPRDRTAPAAAAVYPDRVIRLWLLAAEQLAFVFVEPETKVPDDFEAVYPDRLELRLRVQPDAEALTPRDRTAPAFDAVYPDAVRRPVVLAAEQLALVFVEPETKVPDDFDAVYPDRLDPRRVQQPDAEAMVLRDRAAPLATVVYPDRLDGRYVQQPASLVETLVPPSFTIAVEAFFPARVERRTFHPVQQQAHAFPVGRHLSGVTRDAGCVPLSFCTVHLFRTSDDVEVGRVTSDEMGNYSFALWDDGTVQYYVVAYLAGATDLAGTSVNTLVST